MTQAEPSVFVKGDKVTEQGLKTIIQNEIENALGVDGGKLSNERRDALKWYLGEKYGNEVTGRSQVVDRTVLETVEWVLPALLRIFTGADKIVNVEPQLPQDEQQAEQQTEYLDYIFNRDNPGFLILHTWFKDALLQKLGWVKAYWDIERVTENESYQDLSEEQYQALIADPDIEVVERVAHPAFGPLAGLAHAKETRQGEEVSPLGPGNPLAPIPANTGSPAPTVYDCTLRRTKELGRARIDPVAPEEILVSRRATPGRNNIPFVAHRRRCTRSELIEMGFDSETVMTLSPFDEQEYNTERVERFQKNDEWPYRSSRTDPAAVEVWISECYLKVDMEGDGITKLRKVVVAGDKAYTIMSNDLADEVPFYSITPIPMPHNLVGLSIADVVQDLQLIKTTIWRQMLDNLYLANNQRTYVNENKVTENTYDDLLSSRPGAIVRGDGPMDQVIQQLETPFVAAQAFPMIEYIDQQVQTRSGISKSNQGLAPDDLNKNSQVGSMGVAMLQEQAAQRVELIARNFAEGVKELFRGILGLVIRNQQDPRVVKLTGQWTPVDPRSWKHQMEMSVSVGLGTGNRDRQVAQLAQLLQAQAQVVMEQKGINGPLITGKNIYHTWKQWVSAMGFKNTDDFVTDPSTVPPPPPPGPPPEVQTAQIKAQADQQTAQVKSQTDQQQAAAELAMRERLGVLELQMKQAQWQQDFELKKAQLGLDAQTNAAELSLKAQDQSLKGQDHELKKRAAAGPAPVRKIVQIHRGPDGKVSHATVDETPAPQPGVLPMGPQPSVGGMA